MSADTGIILGALGFMTGIASLVYARSQALGAHAQVDGARQQAVEALRAAALVAEGAREQAAEALRAAAIVAEGGRQQAIEALKAAGLVAEGAREQAAEALRAAGLVAESARTQAAEALRAAAVVAQSGREQAAEALRAAALVADSARVQAAEALRAAELLASSAVSARVREVRARNLHANPSLPARVQETIAQAGGPAAYSVMLDAIDVAQEIYFLRERGLVSDEDWRRWMDDQMLLIAHTPSFQGIFRRDASDGILRQEFVVAFEPVFAGQRVADPRRTHTMALEA
ncbi:MAG TPA: hypothetical protein VM286_08175 [Candidatus Thermoplasmatota archaeon]|nr:hypothetical protein [Candidatus Thermoplasmatota archaeon]